MLALGESWPENDPDDEGDQMKSDTECDDGAHADDMSSPQTAVLAAKAAVRRLADVVKICDCTRVGDSRARIWNIADMSGGSTAPIAKAAASSSH